MYERMLNKQVVPTVEEMTAYCGENAELFTQLNKWLSNEFFTEQKIVFPYGNRYGWGIAHRKKQKLLCNIFAEDNRISGFIDLGRAGTADIWQDIALCVRSLEYNTGKNEGYVNLLFEELGMAPDWDKIRYYVLLDELF